jgi:hypothetical protein
LKMSEKGKPPLEHYAFLFHNVLVLAKEVQPQAKYKVLIVVKIRSSLRVFKEDNSENAGTHW